MHDEKTWQGREQCYVSKVADRIETELGIDRGRDALRDGEHAKRVAIRRRLRALFGADIAPCPGTVVGYQLNAPRVSQALGQEAAQYVARATGRKRDDESQWPGRIGLRKCKRWRERPGHNGRN